MKRRVINLVLGALVVVLLLKMTFMVEIPQDNTFTVFLLEMNEVESEDSQRFDTDSTDEFLDTPFDWIHSKASISSRGIAFFETDKESHISEIVSPPPQIRS